MVRSIRKSTKESLSILEVGPGTGPFTRQILKLMGPNDQLQICEINPRFVAQLKRELPKNRWYRQHQKRVEFFEGPVQELARQIKGKKFDYIVSSLPFSNFSPEMVEEILHLLNDMLVDDGVLTFCEYVGIRKIARLFPKRRENARAVDRVMRSWCLSAKRSGKLRRDIALLNVPPAFTFECLHQANGKGQTNGSGQTNGVATSGTSANGAASKNGYSKSPNLNGSHTNGTQKL